MTNSARRRPQLAPRGERAVLLVHRDGRDAVSRAQAGALREILASGFHLVAVLDPADWREAHRMVADGQVDVIVVASPADLPSVRLANYDPRRTQPVPRPELGSAEHDEPPAERTRLIRRGDAEVALSTDGKVVVPARQRRARFVR